MSHGAENGAANVRMTYEDYLALPDDDRRHEILSPSTAARDRGNKPALLARFGVDWYWLVDPDARTVEVLRREDDAFVRAELRHGDSVLDCACPAGVRIDLSRVWSD